MKYTALFMLFSLSCFAAKLQDQHPNTSEVRVVPMHRTQEPDNVSSVLQFPENGEYMKSQPISIQMRLEGYSLGTNSYFPRESEIWNDPKGQSVHVVIDNHPYFAINEAMVDTLDDFQIDYEQLLEFSIPFNLEPGPHTVRVFPVRSFNESLKGDKAFAADTFYFKTKNKTPQVDLSQPYLTFNEPQGEYDATPVQPILLDFYITNCELSQDGYKVRATVDGKTSRILTQWTPYYLYGLDKGKHTVRLQLLDPENNAVPGAFNDITGSFIIN
jgi:hypothetical protein